MSTTDTKSEILSAALNLFARNGYEKTTMRSIAEKVGIKSASIYYFYDSKEDLLNTIFAEFESNFAKYRNSPAAIFDAAMKKPLTEVLSMIFYTFGSADEQRRMMSISRVILSLQYENMAAHNLFEKIMVQDALDYGVDVLKGLHAMGIIKKIDFGWTAFAFHSFAFFVFQENQQHREPFATSNKEFGAGIQFICSAFAQIIGV